MCFPRLEGAIEVEERRPRYQNEPHRKRLRLVRDRDNRQSDEWTLARSSDSGRRFPRQEMTSSHPWPQQRWLNQHSFGGHPHPPPLPPPPAPMYPPVFQDPRHGGFHPQPMQEFGHGIERVDVEEFNPGNRGHHQEVMPRYREIEPRHHEPEPRSQMPQNLTVNIDSGRSRRGRSGTRSRSRDPHRGRQGHPVYSDETLHEKNSRGNYQAERRRSRMPSSSFGASSYDSFDNLSKPWRRSGSSRRPMHPRW